MKANRGQIEKAFDAAGQGFRLFLLYGPDESGCRALAQRLVRAMGPDAERVDLDGATLKADPARLADEAASFSLFGGSRYIIVQGGDECLAAVEALLAQDNDGNPTLILAGALKGGSALLKRLLADPAAACLACYTPNESEQAQIAQALALEQGLRLDPEQARRLVALSGNDRAVLAREIEKLALFLDASPAQPNEVAPSDIDAIGADNGEPDLTGLVDAMLGGRIEALSAQLTILAVDGVDGIALLRPALRRVQLLIKLKSEMANGKPLDTLVQPLFWKERGPVAAQVKRWSAERLAIMADRLLDTERMIKASRSAGPILADAEFVRIARAARR